MAIEREDWGPGGEHRMPLPAPKPTGEVDGAAIVAEIEAKHGGAPSSAAPPQSDVVPGVGLSRELCDEFWRMPDGFEANYSRLFNAALDLADGADDPKALVAAFDTLPLSAQTKAWRTVWANAGAPLDRIYAKLKGVLTLDEASAVERAWRSLQRRGADA